MKKLILLIVIILIGCEGKQGLPGEPGKDGNANVQILEFSFHSYELIASNNDYRIYELSKSLTDFNTNNQAILFYISSDNTAWFQIPYNEPTFNLSLAYYFNSPNLLFDVRTDNGNARDKMITLFNNNTIFNCKIILIPPQGLEGEEINKYLND